MIRSDLRPRRLAAVWAPLAVTFLLITGSTPVINACINRLPGRVHETDLAAFALFLSFIVVLHSPLFVAREIALKLSVDKAGARRALLFCLSAAAVLSLLEVLVGFTPLGRVLMRAFAESEEVVAAAQRAFRYIWPSPFVIAVRGVYQARQIRHDDTLFVSLGTLVRLIVVAVFGLLAAPSLGMEGPTLGAIAVVIGITIEMTFSVARARRIEAPPETSDEVAPGIGSFALPLMFANLLGVLTSLFYLRVAATVPEAMLESSLAAYQEVRPLAWFFSAGGFALQSLTTAKVRAPEDEAPMIRFSLMVGGAMTVGLGLLAFVPPLREWVLVDLLGERRGGRVVAFAVPTLMVSVALPVLQSFRFTVRGILISRGQTRTITLTNIVSLAIVASALAWHLVPQSDNGARNAYVLWVGVLLLEIALLVRFLVKPLGKDGLPPPARGPHEAAGA